MKTILIFIMLFSFAKASRLEDALLYKHCLTYGNVDTINIVTEKPSNVTKRLMLHYALGNYMQISAPYLIPNLDTAKILVVIPTYFDSAGVKIYPKGVLIQSEDSTGINYGATWYCLEMPVTTIHRKSHLKRKITSNFKIDILGRNLGQNRHEI